MKEPGMYEEKTEQDMAELEEQIERGRQAQVAYDYVKEFLLTERAQTIRLLETERYVVPDEIMLLVNYLRLLGKFEARIQTIIEVGKLSEEEMNRDGNSAYA